MPQFRKKPVVIEAVQYVGLGAEDGDVVFASEPPEWLVAALDKKVGEPGKFGVFGGEARIVTLEGDHTATPGDWVIRGVQGELYPCKPEIFAATYELVAL
jgi:hypothetical protein